MCFLLFFAVFDKQVYLVHWPDMTLVWFSSAILLRYRHFVTSVLISWGHRRNAYWFLSRVGKDGSTTMVPISKDSMIGRDNVEVHKNRLRFFFIFNTTSLFLIVVQCTFSEYHNNSETKQWWVTPKPLKGHAVGLILQRTVTPLPK